MCSSVPVTDKLTRVTRPIIARATRTGYAIMVAQNWIWELAEMAVGPATNAVSCPPFISLSPGEASTTHTAPPHQLHMLQCAL